MLGALRRIWLITFLESRVLGRLGYVVVAIVVLVVVLVGVHLMMVMIVII